MATTTTTIPKRSNKTHFHLLSIFPFFLFDILSLVCVMDVVREFYCQETSLSQNAICFSLHLSLSSLHRRSVQLMLRHCQVNERLVCAFASRTIWIRRVLELIHRRGKKIRICLEFGLVPFVSTRMEKKEYRRQKKYRKICEPFVASDVRPRNRCSHHIFGHIFFSSFVSVFVMCARSRTVITPKWRRQINRKMKNSMEMKTERWNATTWMVHVCDLKSTAFFIVIYYVASTKSNLTILWNQFNRLSCNMTCNILFFFIIFFMSCSFAVVKVCLVVRECVCSMPDELTL